MFTRSLGCPHLGVLLQTTPEEIDYHPVGRVHQIVRNKRGGEEGERQKGRERVHVQLLEPEVVPLRTLVAEAFG